MVTHNHWRSNEPILFAAAESHPAFPSKIVSMIFTRKKPAMESDCLWRPSYRLCIRRRRRRRIRGVALKHQMVRSSSWQSEKLALFLCRERCGTLDTNSAISSTVTHFNLTQCRIHYGRPSIIPSANVGLQLTVYMLSMHVGHGGSKPVIRWRSA